MILKRIESPFVFELTNDQGNTCIMDANPAIGGKNKGFRPMELLAGSLVGCISIDVISILNKKRIDPIHYEIHVEGKRAEGIPSPFREIQFVLKIDASINREVVEKIVQLVIDKYCSVAASLKQDIQLVYKIEQK